MATTAAQIDNGPRANGVFLVNPTTLTRIDADSPLPVSVTGGSDTTAANQVITNTEIGIVTEAAPASDTASSGLNGRLQRIAQRITSLIALFSAVAPTDKSGTITLGGTAQTAIAANASRRGYWIQNVSSGDLWVSSLATAIVGQPSMKIPAGALYEAPLGGCPTGAISIIGATTAQAFAAREW